MDFLDPREKKLRNIRLMIGYTLMTVLIFTATLILVYQAYGFGVDRKTGEVIQNGLVYIDSAPDKASIYINGELQKDRTNTRFALKEGQYEITIKRDGYRDWSRKLDVVGGGVERIMYPMLIQTNLAEEEVVNFGISGDLFRTQSPDRRWIMVANPSSFKDFTQLDLKGANARQDIPLSKQILFPEEIFTTSPEAHSLELVEWSNNNEHFLVKHIFGASFEYIILNRDRPETSFNVNRLLEKNLVNLTLRDKKFDHWLYQDAVGGNLFFANAKKEIAQVTGPIVDYKSHGDDIVIYAQKANDGTQDIYFKNGETTKLLKKIAAGVVDLEIARYDGDWFVVVATEGDRRIYIYKNPWDIISKDDGSRPAPQSIMHIKDEIKDLAFSSNTQFIFARDKQHFVVYDFEKDKNYSFNFQEQIDQKSEVKWMDGHRLLVFADGKNFFVEFNGINKQSLLNTLSGDSVFFDRDYTVLYTVQNSKKIVDSKALVVTDLRYEQDK